MPGGMGGGLGGAFMEVTPLRNNEIEDILRSHYFAKVQLSETYLFYENGVSSGDSCIFCHLGIIAHMRGLSDMKSRIELYTSIKSYVDHRCFYTIVGYM